MNTSILDFTPGRSPFGKSIAIHGALGAILLGCVLWSTLTKTSGVVESPISLELQGFKTSFKSAAHQPQKTIVSHDLQKSSDTSASPGGSGSTPQTNDSSEDMGSTKNTYLSELRNFIERHKSYPSQAKTLGHEGQAEIRFSILSDGTLSSIELLRSSGSSILDQAALSLLQRVQKLSPIPNELRMTQLDLVLPIQYSLN